MKQFLIAIIILFSISLYAQQKIETVTVVGEDANARSTAAKVPSGYVLTGLQLPAMTANTDSLYFLASLDGGATYDSLYYDGEVYRETGLIATGMMITLKYVATFNLNYFKIAFDQVQAADRTIKLIYTK